jgi:hypothetical protein
MTQPLIRLYFCDAFCLTADEFEAAERELLARALTGDVTVVEKIVYRLLTEHRGRYAEVREQLAQRTAVRELDDVAGG